MVNSVAVKFSCFQQLVNGHSAAYKTNMIENRRDTVLMTGASSGIGAIAAELCRPNRFG